VKAGEFSRPCSGVTTQRTNKFRSQGWEDQAPEETPQRRVQQTAPPTGRTPAPAPDEMGDVSLVPRFGSSYDPPSPPAGRWMRALKTLAVLLLLGSLSTGAYLLKTFLQRDNRFRIAGAGNIAATGLTEVTRAEMLPVFGEDIGRNIFFVPLAERRRQLEQIPWIEHATVMRLLPDQIRVSIVERQPVAFVRQGDQVGLVDANGVLLSMPAAMMAQHHFSFPVLTGIASQDAPAAAKLRMGLYQRLLAELDANGKHLSEQISEIDLTDPEDARVLMAEQGGDILAHMGEDHFLDRYLRYRAHIAEWRQQYPKLTGVDLRYEQQAVLQMTPGADDAQPASHQVAASGASPAKPSASKPALQTQAQADHPAKLVHAANTPQSKNSAANKAARQSRTNARNKAKRAAQKRSAREISQQRKPQPALAAGQGQ